jgi:hypothetical protein
VLHLLDIDEVAWSSQIIVVRDWEYLQVAGFVAGGSSQRTEVMESILNYNTELLKREEHFTREQVMLTRC